MNALEQQKIHCPYCGEPNQVLIDCSEQQQNYVEDCQVCCQPIVFDVAIPDDGESLVTVYRENE